MNESKSLINGFLLRRSVDVDEFLSRWTFLFLCDSFKILSQWTLFSFHNPCVSRRGTLAGIFWGHRVRNGSWIWIWCYYNSRLLYWALMFSSTWARGAQKGWIHPSQPTRSRTNPFTTSDDIKWKDGRLLRQWQLGKYYKHDRLVIYFERFSSKE